MRYLSYGLRRDVGCKSSQVAHATAEYTLVY